MELLQSLIMGFFGGVFGAYIGGLGSFVLCGFLGLVGAAIFVVNGDSTFINEVAFGPLFSPATAFVGGVAAAAYLGRLTRNKRIATDVSGAGTDIVTPLYKTQNISVLIVGGIFGLIGQGIVLGLNAINFVADNAAIAVVVAAMLSRLVFDDTNLLGKDFSWKKRTEDWSLNTIIFNIFASYAIGVLIAVIVDLTGVLTFGFLLGAFTLIFIMMGFNWPMTHHITMCAAFGFLAFGNIWIAGLFGITAYLLSEVLRRVFNANVDSHIDHPAFTIALHSLLLLNI